MRTTDERVFTAGVMAEVRKLAPNDVFWRPFVRWALPALALSLGGFMLSVQETIQEEAQPMATILVSDRDTADTDEWILEQEVDA